MIRSAVGDYLAGVPAGTTHPFLAHSPTHWRLNVWATLLDAQGYQAPHIHPAGWLSGVYYVELPAGVDESDGHAGSIEFGRPPERLDDGSEHRIRMIHPREGLMLLFPSYFYHRTVPFAGGGTRISIAFDVLPARDSGGKGAQGANVEELVEQAQRWRASGSAARAEETARQALELDRANVGALNVLARTAFDRGDVPVAVEYLRRAIHAAPDTAQYHIDIATCLRVLQRHDEAVAEMERGFALGADYALAWQTMGGIMADLGRQPESEAAFRTAIARNPALGSAWYGLAQVKRFGADDPDFAAMLATLARDDLAPRDRANLHTALGRAYEDTGDYDTAFDHFRSGNDIKHSLKPFDAVAERDNARRIVSSFTKAAFDAAGEGGNASELPVFVVGMPRSGTTLVEQILDSHPRVFGAGEINHLWRTVTQIGMYLPRNAHLPEAIGAVRREAWPFLAETYLDGLRLQAPWAARIVDKLPFNYTLLGVVRLMLPRAHIIHCVRDPIDTCVSCFTTSFANDRGFTNRLEDLGVVWRAYREVMDHWEAVLPGGLLTVRYEDLVADTETVARRMIDYVGLEWSDACLDFHRNPRAVVTASRAQVRQPAYRSSVGRWRRYERHLGSLREALGDALDREPPA
ncbi:MAG TPA: sulfotransferase [Burkholderiales bacterium]|nr:sulfotransferase [Burkholderiales bacterium]